MPVRSLLLFSSLVFLAIKVTAQPYDPPPNYYNAANGLSGSALKASLHTIIRAGYVKFPYSSNATDTWDILSAADEDPDNPANVRTIYKNQSMVKTSATGPWNREHCWPDSYGFDAQQSWAPFTDCHMLHAVFPSYNSARNNKPYNWVTNGVYTYPVDDYPGLLNRSEGTYWEVWPLRRGDVARACLYMAVRYEGDATNEPNLELTDNLGLVVTGSPYMGKLNTLLQWHFADLPTEWERRRNHVVYGYQRNRNPFIDHPEYALGIWGAQYPLVENTLLSGTLATSASQVVLQAVFSKSITGALTSHFTTTQTAGTFLLASQVTAVSPLGEQKWAVTVNSLAGDGYIRLDVQPNQNMITTSGQNVINLPFTTGQLVRVDTVRPRLSSIDMAGPGRAWLTFNEPMAQDARLFNSSNYVFQGPSGAIVAGHVLPIAPNVVELQAGLLGGITYTLQVAGDSGAPGDALHNPVDPAYNSIQYSPARSNAVTGWNSYP